jgi:hypothetical protein
MNSVDLALLKASVDTVVEVDTRAGESLTVRIISVFDEEDSPDFFYELIAVKDASTPIDKLRPLQAIQLSDVVAVRTV